MWSPRCLALAAGSSARSSLASAAPAASLFVTAAAARSFHTATRSTTSCIASPIHALNRARTATAASSSRRALHSTATAVRRAPSLAAGASAPPSVPTPLPTAPSFDAPLPTLKAPDSIDPSELTIDESAVKRLRSLRAQFGHPVSLRVLVDQGGCSGLEYKFQVEHGGAPEEEDIEIIVGGERVWVDRDSWLWLRGSRIEYQQEIARSAFIVAANPNATQACGCKSSFAPKTDPRVAAATPAAAAESKPAV